MGPQELAALLAKAWEDGYGAGLLDEALGALTENPYLADAE